MDSSFLKGQNHRNSEQGSAAMEQGVLTEKDRKRSEMERFIRENKAIMDTSLAWASTVHGVDTYKCAKRFAVLGTAVLALATYQQMSMYPWRTIRSLGSQLDHMVFFTMMIVRVLCFVRFAVKESYSMMVVIVLWAVYGVYDQTLTMVALMDGFYLDKQRLEFARSSAISLNIFALHISQVNFLALKTIFFLFFHVYSIIIGTKYLVAVTAEKSVNFMKNMFFLMEGKEAPTRDDVIREYELPKDENKRKSIILITRRFALVNIFLVSMILVGVTTKIVIGNTSVHYTILGPFLYVASNFAAEIAVLFGLRTQSAYFVLTPTPFHFIQLLLLMNMYIYEVVLNVNSSSYAAIANSTILFGLLSGYSVARLSVGMRCFNYIFASSVYNAYQTFDEKHGVDTGRTIVNSNPSTNSKFPYL